MKTSLAILVLALVWAGPAAGQTLSFGLGDAEIEASLNTLNASATVDVAGFKAEVTLQWGVPEAQVTAVLSQGLAPAEVYLAASLVQASGQSLDAVVTQYKKNKAAGWGALAKSLGVKPGSPAFKALKDKSKASAAKGKAKPKK